MRKESFPQHPYGVEGKYQSGTNELDIWRGFGRVMQKKGSKLKVPLIFEPTNIACVYFKNHCPFLRPVKNKL